MGEKHQLVKAIQGWLPKWYGSPVDPKSKEVLQDLLFALARNRCAVYVRIKVHAKLREKNIEVPKEAREKIAAIAQGGRDTDIFQIAVTATLTIQERFDRLFARSVIKERGEVPEELAREIEPVADRVLNEIDEFAEGLTADFLVGLL